MIASSMAMRSPLSSPPPLAGEGQGEGTRQAHAFAFAPSPTLPRKRGREHTSIRRKRLGYFSKAEKA